MKALYVAFLGSALLTAYAPDITLASDHVGGNKPVQSSTAARQSAMAAPIAPAACMILGKSQSPGLPYANGGVAAHVYDLTRPLPTGVESRIYLAIGRKLIPLNVTRTGNGSIISFIDEPELAMIAEATEKSNTVRVVKVHPLWQAAAYVPAQAPAAILSCANAVPVQAEVTYQ